MTEVKGSGLKGRLAELLPTGNPSTVSGWVRRGGQRGGAQNWTWSACEPEIPTQRQEGMQSGACRHAASGVAVASSGGRTSTMGNWICFSMSFTNWMPSSTEAAVHITSQSHVGMPPPGPITR
jgi:hypothetical protein